MRLLEGQQSTAWVKRLPEVCSPNGEITRLIGKKPAEAIKEKAVAAKLATPYLRPFEKKKKINCLSMPVFVTFIRMVSWKAGGTCHLSQLVFESLQRSATLCEGQRANCLSSARRLETGICSELLSIPPNTFPPPVEEIHPKGIK